MIEIGSTWMGMLYSIHQILRYNHYCN